MLGPIKKLLRHSLTWWNGQTIGTWLHTKRFGHFVGNDEFGNTYYQNLDKSRRWVIFKETSEASNIPPDWHAWLHKMVQTPPSEQAFHQKAWEKTHTPNLTGTSEAYVPPSSLTVAGDANRRKASGDYEAWQPK